MRSVLLEALCRKLHQKAMTSPSPSKVLVVISDQSAMRPVLLGALSEDTQEAVEFPSSVLPSVLNSSSSFQSFFFL